MNYLKLFVPIALLWCMVSCTPKKDGSKGPLAEEMVAQVTSGKPGNYLLIKGHGFSRNKLENRVIFGNKEAVVLVADSRSLLVKVPAGTGTVKVIVAVQENISNAMDFEYKAPVALAAADTNKGSRIME